MTPPKPSTVTELDQGAREAAASAPDVDMPPVHVAWRRVMDQVQSVGKTGHNAAQNFNFRGIDAVVNAVGPALRAHGVIVVPALKSIEYRDVEVGKNRTLMTSVRVEVRYCIVGPAGDPMVFPDPDFGKVAAEAMDSGDKATSKAMSVAERTFLIQALMLPTHQPDPDEQVYERSTAREVWDNAARKNHLVALAEGDVDLASKAWSEIVGVAVASEADLTEKFTEWVNQPAEVPADA